MNFFKYLIFTSLLFLFSCQDELTFNGKSEESFEKSMTKIKGELTGIESDKLGEAISIFIKYKTTGETDKAKWYQVRKLMHKKTIDEVFALAEQVAKENNFAWMRNSAPNNEFALPKVIDTVKIEDPNRPKYEQIKYATDLKIKVIGYDSDSDSEEDYLRIYPYFVNQSGEKITFSNLPLKALVSIKNDGNLIHTLNADFQNSSLGEPSKLIGIRFPYKYLNSEKMKSDKVDIECKVNTPEGYYTAVQKDFKVYIPKNKKEKSFSDEEENQVKDVIKHFINSIGSRQLDTAFAVTRNPKWKNISAFSDKSAGFGGVSSTEIYDLEVENIENNKSKIQTEFRLVRNGEKLLLEEEFLLELIDNKWYIVDSKVSKVKKQE
ncbi:MAG: hypothetical protein H6604_04935 [Flavobacteriales bacterium]|nr:hypothetical protein [Flavobacteriales bacterium]